MITYIKIEHCKHYDPENNIRRKTCPYGEGRWIPDSGCVYPKSYCRFYED